MAKTLSCTGYVTDCLLCSRGYLGTNRSTGHHSHCIPAAGLKQSPRSLTAGLAQFDVATMATPFLHNTSPLARSDPHLPSINKIPHPNYPVADSPILHLRAVDDGGIDYDTALVACGIVAGNRWDGFFVTRSADGNGVFSPSLGSAMVFSAAASTISSCPTMMASTGPIR